MGEASGREKDAPAPGSPVVREQPFFALKFHSLPEFSRFFRFSGYYSYICGKLMPVRNGQTNPEIPGNNPRNTSQQEKPARL